MPLQPTTYIYSTGTSVSLREELESWDNLDEIVNNKENGGLIIRNSST